MYQVLAVNLLFYSPSWLHWCSTQQCLIPINLSSNLHMALGIPSISINIRGKSLLKLWDATFLPDWQPTLIFVRFISNFLCMCYNSMASSFYFELNRTKMKGGCQSGRRVVPHDSKSDLPVRKSRMKKFSTCFLYLSSDSEIQTLNNCIMTIAKKLTFKYIHNIFFLNMFIL